MARRSWIKCQCGRKLHVKTGNTVCMPCTKKRAQKEVKK